VDRIQPHEAMFQNSTVHQFTGTPNTGRSITNGSILKRKPMRFMGFDRSVFLIHF
jgi:hypothetical protein